MSQFIDNNDVPGFYDHLDQGLKRYLSERLDLPAGAVEFERIAGRCKGKISDEDLTFLNNVLNTGDMIRYGAVSSAQSDLRQVWSRLEGILSNMERRLS
jgi:hypothetical protein